MSSLELSSYDDYYDAFEDAPQAVCLVEGPIRDWNRPQFFWLKEEGRLRSTKARNIARRRGAKLHVLVNTRGGTTDVRKEVLDLIHEVKVRDGMSHGLATYSASSSGGSILLANSVLSVPEPFEVMLHSAAYEHDAEDGSFQAGYVSVADREFHHGEVSKLLMNSDEFTFFCDLQARWRTIRDSNDLRDEIVLSTSDLEHLVCVRVLPDVSDMKAEFVHATYGLARGMRNRQLKGFFRRTISQADAFKGRKKPKLVRKKVEVEPNEEEGPNPEDIAGWYLSRPFPPLQLP